MQHCVAALYNNKNLTVEQGIKKKEKHFNLLLYRNFPV